MFLASGPQNLFSESETHLYNARFDVPALAVRAVRELTVLRAPFAR